MKFELGPGVRCDLSALIDTRALVQANSGGGKSHTLRRLLEQTHGRVQQLVIDPEGEFASLRERYDYVLAARHGGETVADPRAAKLLAERLLQLGVSAILDIYELKAHDRIKFVRHFLEALVDAPKMLWHPALVIVDEAHVFCPQQGEAESAPAVIDLCTRGRKRGFSAILATQRLSKLHKDAAAELNNKLIGRTGLDVDRRRAGEELGFTTKEQLLSLRQLEPGHFYAFGPALSLEVKEVQVGPVQTTHPKAGSRIAFAAPPATEKIRALLPQLADLPAEAEEKARTEADLRKELAAARASITRLERAKPEATPDPAFGAALRQAQADLRQLRAEAGAVEGRNTKLSQALERLMKFILEINAQDFFKAGGKAVDKAAVQKAIDAAAQQLVKLVELDVGSRRAAFERWQKQGEQLLAQVGRLLEQDVKVSVAVRHNEPFTVKAVTSKPPMRRSVPVMAADGGTLTSAQQAILNAAAFLESIGITQPDVVQLALFAGQSASGGYWRANIGRVRTLGLMQGTQLTDEGRKAAAPASITSVEELHAHVFANLLEGAQRPILKVLVEVYPEGLDADELGRRAGLEPNGGYWRANIGRLRSLGLITKRGPIAAMPVLFLEGA